MSELTHEGLTVILNRLVQNQSRYIHYLESQFDPATLAALRDRWDFDQLQHSVVEARTKGRSPKDPNWHDEIGIPHLSEDN